MTLLLEGAVEAALILAVALAAMPLLRRHPAALRHGLLATALTCCALAPIVGAALPSWTLPAGLPPAALRVTDRAGSFAVAAIPPPPTGREPRAAAVSRAQGRLRTGAVLAGVWAAGTLCALAALAAGLWRVRRLACRAQPVEGGPWFDRASAIAARCGLRRRVTLLQGTSQPLLVTWGLLRPRILLPPAAASWPGDRIDVTLRHELAHVRRHDWAVVIGAEIVKAVYWFNPLVWLACARLRRDSEQACDDAVIAAGTSGPDYAIHLVNIARELKPQARWMPAHGIARPSNFERRIRAMLDPHRNRRPVSRATYAALALALAAVSLSIAAAQQRLSTVTGAIADATSGTLPGVTVVLTNVQNESKYEVRTNATGRYEFAGVPAGEYLFEARLPGFSTFKSKVTIAGDDVQRDLTLELGSLEETITVSSVAAGTPPAVRSASRRPLPDCVGQPRPTTPGQVTVGGNVRPPHKVVDVRPVYPAHLAAAGIHGQVVLKGRIGVDGRVEELQVASAAHQELATAAVDAVSRWEFDETLLNCVPAAIAFTARINFVR